MSDIKHLNIDNVDCFENNRGKGVVISWSANIGWGEVTLYQRNEDDKWRADTECMCRGDDKDFIRMLLDLWVDKIEVD